MLLSPGYYNNKLILLLKRKTIVLNFFSGIGHFKSLNLAFKLGYCQIAYISVILCDAGFTMKKKRLWLIALKHQLKYRVRLKHRYHNTMDSMLKSRHRITAQISRRNRKKSSRRLL